MTATCSSTTSRLASACSGSSRPATWRRWLVRSAASRPWRSSSGWSLPSSYAAWGVDDLTFYQGFAARVEALGATLKDLLSGLRKDGKHVAAYGAAAKGSTLLNFFGLGAETLEYVVDRSTYKQGRYMPGVHLPI